MFYACATRFDVIENLEKFWKLNKALNKARPKRFCHNIAFGHLGLETLAQAKSRCSGLRSRCLFFSRPSRGALSRGDDWPTTAADAATLRQVSKPSSRSPATSTHQLCPPLRFPSCRAK